MLESFALLMGAALTLVAAGLLIDAIIKAYKREYRKKV